MSSIMFPIFAIPSGVAFGLLAAVYPGQVMFATSAIAASQYIAVQHAQQQPDAIIANWMASITLNEAEEQAFAQSARNEHADIAKWLLEFRTPGTKKVSQTCKTRSTTQINTSR